MTSAAAQAILAASSLT